LIRRLEDPRWKITLYVTPDIYQTKGRFWPFHLRYAGHLKRVGQGAGDLGTRMQKAFDREDKGAVVIIGSDIPSIQKSHISEAFQSLKTHGVVLGPAHDGGYWLVGQRRFPKVYQLFNNVRWSSEYTLEDTVKNIPTHEECQYLECLRDVDYGVDLDYYKTV
jgi:glycosyltransferase A (GT-A) superfamily protein (DUF2064 family)